MIQTISITVPLQKENDASFIQKAILGALSKINVFPKAQSVEYTLVKRSIDARHGRQKLFLRYNVFIGESVEKSAGKPYIPRWQKAAGNKTVIIVGLGPAGLFGAFTLLEYGIKPIIVERGKAVEARKQDIANIPLHEGINPNSNYCFGEGGAGTFSDGKLYTRSNKRGNIPEVLRILHHFGADKNILTDAHPHIGSDNLPAIIKAMRETLISLGAEIHFGKKCVDFLRQSQNPQALCGIVAQDTETGQQESFLGDAVVLSTGHSARDIYELLANTAPASLEAKTFAVGVRVEHPRALIDSIQFKKTAEEIQRAGLLAAEYRFTSRQDGRGVYSFCMCPGGFVVPSATEPNHIVVNGMSCAMRDSAWSNAAFVVETTKEDIEALSKQFHLETDITAACPALLGLSFRTMLEHETFLQAHTQNRREEISTQAKAPAQRLTDFLAHTESASLPKSSYAPGIVPSRLDLWLPEHIGARLHKAFLEADTKMHGFVTSEAVLIASETRTSTPVRIARTASGESVALHNLFPAGEGSGYSGGIVSSAMDGIKICTSICQRITNR